MGHRSRPSLRLHRRGAESRSAKSPRPRAARPARVSDWRRAADTRAPRSFISRSISAVFRRVASYSLIIRGPALSPMSTPRSTGTGATVLLSGAMATLPRRLCIDATQTISSYVGFRERSRGHRNRREWPSSLLGLDVLGVTSSAEGEPLHGWILFVAVVWLCPSVGLLAGIIVGWRRHPTPP